MKILQVNNYGFVRGGSDKYFLDLSHLLVSKGHKISYLSSRNANNVVSTGFDVCELNIDSPSPHDILSFLYSRDARNKMAALLDQECPDLVHLHIYYGQITSSILPVIKRYGIPIVQTLHEYKLVCPVHSLYAHGQYCDDCKGRHYWNALLRRCNRSNFSRSMLSMIEAYVSDFMGAREHVNQYIAVSEFQKQQLVRMGIPQQKLSVLHHFCELIPSEPSRECEYFLYVGRILKEKGVKILLDAYALLIEEDRLPLKIVGEGDVEHYKEYVGRLSLSNEVEWLGFRQGDELEQLYRGCLALVNPSLLNETFGLTCLEAIARGKPVIASRSGAFSEVITDRVDGILVDAGDAEALAAAMQELASQPDVAISMGKEGVEKATTHFSREKHLQGLIKIYEDVIRNDQG